MSIDPDPSLHTDPTNDVTNSMQLSHVACSGGKSGVSMHRGRAGSKGPQQSVSDANVPPPFSQPDHKERPKIVRNAREVDRCSSGQVT